MNHFGTSQTAIVLVSIIEIIVLAFVLIRVNKVRKAFYVLRADGAARLDALEQSLSTAIPAFAAKVLVMELRIYNTIFRFLARRKELQCEQFLTKRETTRILLLVIVFLSIIETAVIEIAIPSKYLFWKALLIILNLWAITYITGIYLSIARGGHVILDNGIKLQVGFGVKGFMPYDKISLIAKQKKGLPSFSIMPFMSKTEPGVLYATAGEDCNVTITYLLASNNYVNNPLI
ncbi:MAG: hypothetical protein IBX64_07915 [Actinobacteria bacterium]|nr:hypothetical protein [Actinomycetota bacterium]